MCYRKFLPVVFIPCCIAPRKLNLSRRFVAPKIMWKQRIIQEVTMASQQIRSHVWYVWIILCILVLSNFSFVRPAQAAYSVTGIVFRDYNANGKQEVTEPGVGGVQVVAYNATASIASTSSAATGQVGSYTLTIPTDEAVRIEFSPPAYFFAGATGTNNDSSVVFVNSTQRLDYGLSIPGDYCQSNPDVATNCYVQGDQQSASPPYPRATESVMLRTAYTSSGTTAVSTTLAIARQIGSTWGLAHQQGSDTLFAGAFYKRHAGLGPNGTGAIYAIRNANTATPVVSLFLDLNAVLAANVAGVDTRSPSNYLADRGSFDIIGKIALGDLEISDDDQTLWAVSLFTREIIRMPIGVSGSAPAAGAISRFAIPIPTGAGFCPSDEDIRPFGLGYHNGQLFVGLVCSAESTQDVNDLRALIYTFDPQTNSFSAQPVVNIPLNYPRKCVDYINGVCPPGREAAWNPWQASNTLQFSAISSVDFFVSYPQPWLTDIVFDGNAMILGLRDRFGDQSGKEALPPDPSDNQNYTGLIAGDILRLCPNGNSWALETNGSCSGVSTSGANTGEGPGGGEFYHGENHPFHDEVALGGLAQVPGHDDLVSTAFDPIPNPANTFESGFIWLSNTTGERLQNVRLRASTGLPINFGKANGLGDIEALCNAAPVEIGNRVWLDTDNDGVQDANEAPVPNVIVELVDAQGALISSALTNAQGHYFFSNDGQRTGETSSSHRYGLADLKPGSSYTVRIPLNQAVLNQLRVTKQSNDATTNGVIRDSDGNNQDTPSGIGSTGYTQVSLLVTGIGQNNQTFDFGFSPGPTAITLSRFTTTAQSNAVLLRCETARAIGSFGSQIMCSSNIQRQNAVLITSNTIPAQGHAADYDFLDTTAQGEELYYWLVEIALDGTRTEYGPFSLQQPYSVWLPMVE